MSKKRTQRPKLTKPQKDWLAQAAVLSEAMPFMQRHAGETFVIKDRKSVG